MSEREDIGARKDRADSTERRDWDLPPSGGEEPADVGAAEAGGSGRAVPGEPDEEDAPEVPFEPGHGEPADESERRDWDLP